MLMGHPILFDPSSADVTNLSGMNWDPTTHPNIVRFRYDALLPSSFVAQAGIYYWITVYSGESEFQWQLVNDHFFDRPDNLEPGNVDRSTRSPRDVAFELRGTSVPVPGAIWLLGSGLVSLMGIRKKFKK